MQNNFDAYINISYTNTLFIIVFVAVVDNTPIHSMQMSKQEVINLCKKYIDWTHLTGNNHTLCIDGTSCTKKSSILNATRRSFTKISRLNNFQNTDTYFPSMLGYICRGMLSLCEGGPHFNDRSPLNVLDWAFLWRVLNDFLITFGNVRPNVENLKHLEFITNIESMVRNFRNSYYRKIYSTRINCIALIDSDLDRCDGLHKMRNESSDCERAQWKFYTFFQNLMYRELYPGSYIDLVIFEDAPTDVVVEGIADFCNMTLDHLIESRRNPCPRPLPVGKLPTIVCDYNLVNMETHIYRSIGRRACKEAVGVQEDISKYIPAYCNVSNIKNLDGTMHPDIIAKRIDHLFDVDHTVLVDDFNLDDSADDVECSYENTINNTTFIDKCLDTDDLMMGDSGVF